MGAATDNPFLWYYGQSRHPEYYKQGRDTREKTIEEARGSYPDGDFTICEATKSVPSFDHFDADWVLEHYEEHNEECWGEDGAEISPTPAQARELEQMLAGVHGAWAKKHDLAGRAWAFGETRNEEYFPYTADPEAQS